MVKYYSEQELKELFSVMKDKEKKLIFQMYLELGCRNGELRSLPRRRIKGNYVKIWDEKKDEFRDCYISDELAEQIEKEYWKIQTKVKSGPRMFCYYSGKTLNNWLKEYCKKANIPEDLAHIHTFRHTHIVFAWNRKWNPKSICDQTGDTLKTLVEVYSELDSKGRKDQWKEKPLFKNLL